MNRFAGRLWVKVFVKAHIRAVWNKLNNMTDYDDPSSAFESLIRLTSTDSSYCDLLGVMVDTISPESPMASWFLYHIIDLAALPSQQTIRRLSQELLSKCSPGGLARLRTRKRCRPTAALVWGVLASRLAGELSTILFSDEVCDCLLNNIEYDPDMLCKVFSIIALEKFALTGPCKIRIMQKPIQTILREVARLSTSGLTNEGEIAGIQQAKFCADWALRRVFNDTLTQTRRSYSTGLVSSAQDRFSSSANALRGSMSSSESTSMGSEKSHAPKNSHIKVMLNVTEASRHWKISEDGLMVRNDGSSFESIRATVSVTCGKWYYEVTVLTSGIMQIGWATPQCRFCPDEGTGVGDDLFGFSYDGCRNLLWANGESTHYGDSGPWRPGDVLGFYLDVDNSQLECFINGVPLGNATPFTSIGHFQDQAAAGYFPAFSITPLQQIELNFGASPFRYAPARPWRNLNDHGTLTPELREAITKTRADDIASKLRLDPETGLRVAMVTEQEIDYSSLCTICCDHAATITLHPCGHDGLCVQCAYALDQCPMCRTRIFQRQMAPTSSEPTEGVASGSCGSSAETGVDSRASGLCISGVSGSFSAPQLNAQGDIVCSESSLLIPADRPLTAAEAAARRLSRRQSTIATTSIASMSTSSSSHSAIAENANATATHAEELEDTNPSPEDVFSPPSTAYFRFLTGLAPGSRHPTSGIHPFATDSSTSSCNRESLASPTSALVPPLPSSQPSTSQASMVAMTGDEHRAEEMHQDVGARGDNSMAFMEDEERDEEEHADDASPRSMSSLDSFGSGREARLDELMERVVPDFPDASALSCHRNSITTSMPNMASLASMTGLTSGVAGVAPGGAGSGGVSGYSSGNNNNNMGSSSSTSSMPPLPLQDALPLPSPAQRPLPPLMPSQYAMGAHSASSPAIASAPLPNFSAGLHPMHQHYFPPQHQALPQPQPQPTGTESAASIGRRSSLADDMRLLLQQQGILPAQPPQSPMVGTTAVMQSQGGRRGGNAAVGSFEPLSLSIGSEPDEAAGTFQQQQQQQDVPLEQRVSYMALRETESSPDSLAPLPTLASFATAYANTTGSSGRSSGRRASLPANRLEM